MDSPNRVSHIAELHQLRGMAALLVFFYHAMHSGRNAMGITGWPEVSFPPEALLWEGHTGVSLFLVLSGFILSIGTFDKKISYLGFLERRVRRILPLSIVVIVFAFYATANVDFPRLLAAIFFLKNSPASFSDPAELAGTLWTVAVEFQFYLVAPFIFATVATKGIWRYLLPLACLLFALKIFVLFPQGSNDAELTRISYYTIVGRANQFLIGIGLAYLVFKHPPRRSPVWFVGLALATVAVIGLMYVLNLSGGHGVFRFWHLVRFELEALVWASFIITFWMANPIRWRPLSDSLRNIGTISFGLYVLHYSIQRTFWMEFQNSPYMASIDNLWKVAGVNLAVLAVCIAAAAASWFCIEKPFVENKKRKAYVTKED